MRLRRISSLLLVPLAVLAAGARPASAQTGIQAHYADGQVWVRWTEDAVPPVTYAVYAKNAPFNDVRQAQLVGRLFREEWLPLLLKAQASGTPAGWVIPDGAGGTDTLAANQGLFVFTPLASGNRYFAVVRWGDTTVTPGVNGIGPVAVTGSLADPPEAHLQHEYVQGGQWLLSWYAVWAHGQDDHRGGRPDFPVMANRHKNGMPSLFLLSRPLALPPGPRPLVHWLHGGGGTASQSRPGTRTSVNIDPADGFLCSHNDDFVRYMQGAGVIGEPANTWHFGWTVGHDPFDSTFVAPAPGDTVVNYTQRRYVWIHDWLARRFPVDTLRVAVQGHSVGSAGTIALAKAYPWKFSTVTAFNNGFIGPNESATDELPAGALVAGGVNLFGTRADSLPTNLVRAGGGAVPAYGMFDLATSASAVRDLPLVRSLHGKQDESPTMEWDADVVAQYRAADSLALGAHLYWDERAHGLGAVPSYFSSGTAPALQTQRDDVAYQGRYRKDVSYPAFFNHRLYAGSRDPGDGTRGTTADPVFSGDDWGTWGGYHDWAPDSILDTPAAWEADVWLVSGSAWTPDDCGEASLTTDVAIRRPQAFLPAPGATVAWAVTGLAGDTLQSGLSLVRPDGLVTATGVAVGLAPDRRRLRFALATTGAGGAPLPAPRLALALTPVPVRGDATVEMRLPAAADVALEVYDLHGRRALSLARGAFAAGTHRLALPAGALRPGVHFVRLAAAGETLVRRLVVLR